MTGRFGLPASSAAFRGGEDDVTSDIDLVVDLAPGADLFDLAALDVKLKRLPGHRLTLFGARMLKPHIAALGVLMRSAQSD